MLLCTSFSATNAQTVVNYSLGDDGFAHVPIPFVFPFYGREFTESWMYDNGVISFLNPTTDPQALRPWQWSSSELKDAAGRYFIASLWTDIAPVQKTTYTTSADGTSLKYTWSNISEYYSGGTRLNTFSTTINKDGTFTSAYAAVNLQSSNVSIGAIGGDGEYTQILWATTGTQLTGVDTWSLTTSAPELPCKPMTLCPPSPAHIGVDPTVEPVIEVSPATQVFELAPAISAPASTSPAPIQTTPTPTSSPQATESQSRGSAPSMQQLLSIVASERSRVEQTELAAVTAVEQATQAMVADTVSSSEVVHGGGSQPSLTATTVGAVSLQVGGVDGRLGGSTSSAGGVADVMGVGSTITTSAVDSSLITESVQPIATESVEQQSTQAKSPEQNELAGDVKIESIAVVPAGFSVYTVGLVDAAFYPTTVVYKNQKTVDNARALRQLSGSSQLRHQQMVDQQFK